MASIGCAKQASPVTRTPHVHFAHSPAPQIGRYQTRKWSQSVQSAFRRTPDSAAGQGRESRVANSEVAPGEGSAVSGTGAPAHSGLNST